MPSSGRHILDITKKGPSRGKARAQMKQLFSDAPKSTPRTPKQTRLRDRRRRQRILLACICLLSAAGLVGGIGGVSHLEELAIREVQISGAAAIQPEALTASVHESLSDGRFHLFSRENMFLYPKRAIENTLAAQFPRIKDVALSRPSLLAQAVVVTVEERTAYAKWCADICYVMDSAGFVFAEAAAEATEIGYQFRGGLATDRTPIGQWFLRGRLPQIVGFLEQLGAAGLPAISLTVDTEKDFTVTLESGVQLYVSFDASMDTTMRNLRTTIETDSLQDRMSSLQYIDLRFGNRVYYR